MAIRRKCFISYHHSDQAEVNRFVAQLDTHHNCLIARALGVTQDLINSTDASYIIRRIRELYLTDSTVTIVLIGECTWSRRYVDWEIASTLRNDVNNRRSGLLGVVLPSARQSPRAPARLRDNLKGEDHDGYARWYHYPDTVAQLENMIEDAWEARVSRAQLVKNSRSLLLRNSQCPQFSIW